MKKTETPPEWEKLLGPELIQKSFSSEDFTKLAQKAQKEYMYWESFRYQPMPSGFTPEEAWAILKLNRMSQYQKTPIKGTGGNIFTFALVNSLQQKLSFIDTHAASFMRDTKLSEAQENRFMITGLTEEAIATSQIEGANTTRKAAKEMIASGRKPRTKGEQMIVNSYHVMQKLDSWKELELSTTMLLDIQSIVTENTLEEPSYQGRFRTDADDIVVKDPVSGEVVHTPPKEKEMLSDLNDLLAFANRETGETDEFTHPVIKAIMIHFWISYLHPFPDGNGRTARAIFHWFLLKNNYWLTRYLPVSRAILNSRKRYDDAFIYTELDYDLTYFLMYITDALKISIEKFIEYVTEKLEESKKLQETARSLEGYNERQIAIMTHLLGHERETVDVSTHQSRHGVSRQTAHTDLMSLAAKGLLAQTRQRKRYVFMANVAAIRKILDQKK